MLKLFDDRLTLRQLAERTGVSERKVRYYIAEGLVPQARARGPGAHYDQRHVQAIQDVRTLVDEGSMSLRAVRTLLEAVDDDDVRVVRQVPDGNTEPVVAALPTPRVLEVLERWGLAPGTKRPPRTAPGSRWSRYEVAPGVELHLEAGQRLGEHGDELVQALRDRLDELGG